MCVWASERASERERERERGAHLLPHSPTSHRRIFELLLSFYPLPSPHVALVLLQLFLFFAFLLSVLSLSRCAAVDAFFFGCARSDK